jgi:trans-aconitate methyltransferase
MLPLPKSINNRMNILDKFQNWRRRRRWDKQYESGRWESLKKDRELPRYAALLGYIMLANKDNPRILDLGCGEGVLNEKLPAYFPYQSFTGIDYSKVSIEKAQAKNFPRAEFQCADMHTYTPEGEFDIIIFNEAFYYINAAAREGVLDRVIRHLAPDGVIIFSMYRDAADCWPLIESRLPMVSFATIRTEEELLYWKLGIFKSAGEAFLKS